MCGLNVFPSAKDPLLYLRFFHPVFQLLLSPHFTFSPFFLFVSCLLFCSSFVSVHLLFSFIFFLSPPFCPLSYTILHSLSLFSLLSFSSLTHCVSFIPSLFVSFPCLSLCLHFLRFFSAFIGSHLMIVVSSPAFSCLLPFLSLSFCLVSVCLVSPRLFPLVFLFPFV